MGIGVKEKKKGAKWHRALWVFLKQYLENKKKEYEL